MTFDQAIHLMLAVAGLLIALVGFLAREQLSDLKGAVNKSNEKLDRVGDTLALHGERLAALEAQVDGPRASTTTHAVNGRSRG